MKELSDAKFQIGWDGENKRVIITVLPDGTWMGFVLEDAKLLHKSLGKALEEIDKMEKEGST